MQKRGNQWGRWRARSRSLVKVSAHTHDQVPLLGGDAAGDGGIIRYTRFRPVCHFNLPCNALLVSCDKRPRHEGGAARQTAYPAQRAQRGTVAGNAREGLVAARRIGSWTDQIAGERISGHSQCRLKISHRPGSCRGVSIPGTMAGRARFCSRSLLPLVSSGRLAGD